MQQSASGGGSAVAAAPKATVEVTAIQTGGKRLERTLSIVKPDAVAKNLIGEIYSRFEKGGLVDRRGRRWFG